MPGMSQSPKVTNLGVIFGNEKWGGATWIFRRFCVGLMISKLCVLCICLYHDLYIPLSIFTYIWLYMCYLFNLYIFGVGEVLPLTVILVHDCFFEFSSLKLQNGNVILVGDCLQAMGASQSWLYLFTLKMQWNNWVVDIWIFPGSWSLYLIMDFILPSYICSPSRLVCVFPGSWSNEPYNSGVFFGGPETRAAEYMPLFLTKGT